MKIAYILDDDISEESGIYKKIKNKIEIWQKNGHKVKVYSLRSKNDKALLEEGIVLSKFENKNLLKKLFQQYTNVKKLDECLNLFSPTIIYTRHMKYYPSMVNVLKKHAPYIVELNTNDVEEYKLRKRIVYYYNLLTRKYFLNQAAGFVSVSNEIINDINFSKFNKSSIVIGNGYKFQNIENKKIYSADKPLSFVFIGTPNQEWHGIDKIIYLAKKFPKYLFHIIGPTIQDIRDIDNEISSNIKIYGYCNNLIIEKIILESHIGISTLALHRKKMNEASSLKSRQYLANGLPIIIGYEDTDLPKNCEFILNIGNYENNIVDNIDKIEQFSINIKKFTQKYIIKESKLYLDQENKENKRLNFFEFILKEQKH